MTLAIQRLQARIDSELLAVIGDQRPSRIVLLDAPDYPNVGDQAILLGELAFLRRHFPQASLHLASYKTYHPALDDVIRSADLILLQGGGNFGDIWPLHHDFRLMVLEKFREQRIIHFPQSIYFSDDALEERTRRAIAGCRSFHMVVRDQRALEFAREKLDCAATLCPDMAFAMGPLSPSRSVIDVFCLFRTDKELLEPKAKQVSQLLREAGRSHQVEDWIQEQAGARLYHAVLRRLARRRLSTSAAFSYGQHLFAVYARARMRRGIDLLSRGEVVMTDRLHGFIIATLLGRPTFVWDSLDGKISAFHRAWLPDEASVCFLDRADDVRDAIARYGQQRGFVPPVARMVT